MPVATRSWRGAKRKQKRRAALKDPESTGRKEAARLYPIEPGMLCEWSYEFIYGVYEEEFQAVVVEVDDLEIAYEQLHRNLVKEVSGGPGPPIRPCRDNPAKARHHGPEKNTLNNEEGNVHRICHHCHVNWHAVNDPDYDPNEPLRAD